MGRILDTVKALFKGANREETEAFENKLTPEEKQELEAIRAVSTGRVSGIEKVLVDSAKAKKVAAQKAIQEKNKGLEKVKE